METHSKSIIDESKERLDGLKTKLDDIVKMVKSDSEAFHVELRSMTDEWDTLNSLKPDTSVGTPIRALLFVVFAFFVLLHPGVSLSGNHVVLEELFKMERIVKVINEYIDKGFTQTLFLAQIVLVVAVIWLGVSLWIVVSNAAKYSRRVNNLESKISPYWKMVPGTKPETQHERS